MKLVPDTHPVIVEDRAVRAGLGIPAPGPHQAYIPMAYGPDLWEAILNEETR